MQAVFAVGILGFSVAFTSCPPPEPPTLFSDPRPTYPVVTIAPEDDSASAVVTATLNAEGAAFDEPTTSVWSVSLFCGEIEVVGAPAGAGSPLSDGGVRVEVVPLDLDGSEVSEAARVVDGCRGTDLIEPGHPVPCLPAEACPRSWKVTFDRPAAVELPIVITWDLGVSVQYVGVGVEEVPPGAELTRTLTGVEWPEGEPSSPLSTSPSPGLRSPNAP